MKKILFLTFTFATIFMSCETSVLDKPFNPILYKADFTQFFSEKNISNQDAFLINYAIIRQRDYLGYEVEGKTYGEILQMAKGFNQLGIPLKETYDEAESQDALEVTITNIKSTFLEKSENSSAKVKNLKFKVTYKNVSDKDVALNLATFIINGPFKQHLMTAGYETNCKIIAGETMVVNYVVNSKKIRDNLFYGKTNTIKRVMIDDIIDNLEIKVGGLKLDNNTQYYEECFIEDLVVEPFQLSNYKKMYPNKNFNAKMINGVQTVHRGPRAFKKEDTDEPINYK